MQVLASPLELSPIGDAAPVALRPALQDPSEIHRFLLAAIQKVHHIDIASYEGRGTEGLPDLVAEARACVQIATELLTHIVDHYETRPTHDAWLPEDGAHQGRAFMKELDERLRQQRTTQDIADTAFIARMELRGRTTQLENAHRTEFWDTIALCSDVRAEMLKSLSSIEAMICRVEGITQVNGFYREELDKAMETRRLYTRFFRDLNASVEITADALLKRLRLAGIMIAKITGHALYPDLRVHDRRQLRQLQQRLLEWLRTVMLSSGHLSEACTRAGMQLWSDLVTFAELLAQVNERDDLRAHDREVIAKLLLELSDATAQPTAPLAEKTRMRMERLYGRDATFDDWLRAPSTHDRLSWRKRLLHMQSALVMRDAPVHLAQSAYVDPFANASLS